MSRAAYIEPSPSQVADAELPGFVKASELCPDLVEKKRLFDENDVSVGERVKLSKRAKMAKKQI